MAAIGVKFGQCGMRRINAAATIIPVSTAKRVFQIEKFVTDESNTIVKSMKSASEALDNKQVFRVTENQHQSMTSINNLANMLTDVMEQMQQQMQSSQQQE